MDALIPSIRLMANNSPEEIQMVADTRNNPEAFVALYDRYVLRVYRYMLHRTGDEMTAEDLTSQVFLDALKNLPHFSSRVPFGAWLFTIARRRVADYYREFHPTASLEETQNLPSLDVDPLKELIQTDRLKELETQLTCLDEGERELLRLRFSAELSFAEMGLLLGQKENTVKKSLYRLLDRLGSQMEAKND
jgi:RNA polymerase sigma-70 factor (ECF subfamily)